jgi:hypothetical protein
VIVTKNDGAAEIYELPSGRKLIVRASSAQPAVHVTLTAERQDLPITSNVDEFRPHIACFSPDDTRVLHDGVLYDARSGRQIHRFDKLHEFFMTGAALRLRGASLTWAVGIFHPARPEVVLNNAIWDLRNFKASTLVVLLFPCPC